MPITDLLERNSKLCGNEVALVEIDPEITERQRVTWKEYEMDPTCVADWLSWGGLVHPSIMRGKDDSFFGVLAYEPYIDFLYL